MTTPWAVAPDPSLNRRSYDAIAGQWDQVRHSASPCERPFLDALLAGLAPGSRVLDLGCGTGRPMAEAVLAAGHAVTGIDQSAAMLELARARFPQATWIEAPLEHYEPGPGHGAAIAWDVLFHLPRQSFAPIAARLHQALAPGGALLLTVGGSENPAFTDTMFGATFFYDSHPPDTAQALLTAAGFRIVRAAFLNQPTTGRDKGRFAILAHAGG
ncbi:methyltransferase domain-containing protein [Vulcanococcus limneticus Candia 3F8]|uniref:class I SAM-dependent DNA methyltransferase n=1 Tax=Vulcanococcus limneticus TaxID=2170428 RepID=UPI000B97F834|nr:class I SAM-dependent methyltransferase [Vulcanococcus limneticus]MCP9792529.1 methyltransferase domain-containing protein [Vulcanococcus limneticus MW73D5]MCP9894254.1 methyltransferase domain-containing protein [Vulcanococcus limneticus Candia 3F8]MCP9897877.1 methyltransferase domain-containing protein [Vulcanococcus limneticus Candia 3B3]